MMKPVHHVFDRAEHAPRRQSGTVNQDDGQAKGAGRGQLGHGPCAARVLGDDMGDPVIPQQGKVVGKVKGAARNDSLGIGQRKRAFGRIDKAQQIVVPGLCGKGAKGLLADGQKNPRRRIGQRRDGGFGILHVGPLIAGLRGPWRAFKGRKRQGQFRAGGDGIHAHPGGEGVGRINDMGDALICQVGHQPRHAAKAADPLGQGLRHGRGRAPGVRKDRICPGICQGAGKQACLGRAAQKKDAWHG